VVPACRSLDCVSIRRVLAAARATGITVIHTREGHHPDLTDCPPAKLNRGHPTMRIGDLGPMGRILIRGEYGHDIIDELAPLAGEVVIDKPGKGSFYATDLHQLLQRAGISSLVVTGVTTEVCVHTTVREADDRSYECLTFVIMLPIFLATKDLIRAWEAALAWSFIIGLIVLAGAFVGPYIRRFTPRAALLGTLAGISIAFISMRPAAQMWQALWIALPVFAIIVIGFFTGRKLPGNIPIGLAALLVGTAIGWIGGYMSAPDVVTATRDVTIGLPTLNVPLLIGGLSAVAPLLATAIPLGIYNFCEGMTKDGTHGDLTGGACRGPWCGELVSGCVAPAGRRRP
jgi:hypothetical protein